MNESAGEARFRIRSEKDIVAARQRGRELAAMLEFSLTDQVVVATAVSELARNVLEYAGEGDIILNLANAGKKRGIEIVARDEGPGIPNIKLAMQDGFSTGNSLGMGLPGVRRLMDEFHISSARHQGTTVSVRKWAPSFG